MSLLSLLKVTHINNKIICYICSKLTIKTLNQLQKCRSCILSISSTNSELVYLFKVNISFGFYLLKVNNRNIITSCEICSKVNNKDTFIVNLEHISHLFLAFLLLTLNMV